MIRAATVEDLPRLVELGRLMHAESRFRSIEFVPEKLDHTLRKLMAGAGCVFVAEHNGALVGGFAGIASEYFFSHERAAYDFALFVEPTRRGGIVAAALIRAFVAWGKRAGIRHFECGVSTGVHPEQTGKLFEALGFVRQGALYSMEAG
jgi:GNAT superfamily N-acetyltransferase